MTTTAHPRPTPPTTSRTIYELSKEAHDGLHFSSRYALETWRRSAEALIKKSEEHYRLGQVDLAFILMARAAVLLLEKIPQHPEYLHGLTEFQRGQLRKDGEQCLSTLTTYKSMLNRIEPPASTPSPPQLPPLPVQHTGYTTGYSLEAPSLPPPHAPLPPPPQSLLPGSRPAQAGPSTSATASKPLVPIPVHERYSYPYPQPQQAQAQLYSHDHPSHHEPLINSHLHPIPVSTPQAGSSVRLLPTPPVFHSQAEPQAQPDYQPRQTQPAASAYPSHSHGSDYSVQERARLERKKEIENKDWEYACKLAEEQERERDAGLGLGRMMQGLKLNPEDSPTGLTAMPDPKDYKRRSGMAYGPGPPSGVTGFYKNGDGNAMGYGQPRPHEHPHARHSSHPPVHPSPNPYSNHHQQHASLSSFPHAPPGRPSSYIHIPEEPERHVIPQPRGRRHLRPLQVPISLIPTFLRIASSHTQRGIEMCGLLLGVIRRASHHRHSHSHSSSTHRRRGSDVSIAQSVLGHQEEEFGELEVRALLIPRQEGTSDTCTMKEEERVIGVQLERGLIALGWIHTHPTQSCFMSSMDLHTHSAYQQTLPEAIAIVCAPRSDPAFGIFRLTEPAGLMTVLQCKRRQTFHEHPRIPRGLYTDADHGGHVLLNERGRGIEVIDLRR